MLLFVWSFKSHSRIFHSFGDVTIAGERLQIFTYARHSLSLSSEGFLASHTNCETRHPFIMVISEDPWHTHLLPSVWQWSCHYMFLRLMSVAAGIRTPNLPLWGERSYRLRHHGGTYITQSVYVCTVLSYGNITVLFSFCLRQTLKLV